MNLAECKCHSVLSATHLGTQQTFDAVMCDFWLFTFVSLNSSGIYCSLTVVHNHYLHWGLLTLSGVYILRVLLLKAVFKCFF